MKSWLIGKSHDSSFSSLNTGFIFKVWLIRRSYRCYHSYVTRSSCTFLVFSSYILLVRVNMTCTFIIWIMTFICDDWLSLLTLIFFLLILHQYKSDGLICLFHESPIAFVFIEPILHLFYFLAPWLLEWVR